MKPVSVVAIILIVLGIGGLITERITYTTKQEVLHIGPIEATADKKHVISIPDAAGVLAIAAGVILLVVGTRRA